MTARKEPPGYDPRGLRNIAADQRADVTHMLPHDPDSGAVALPRGRFGQPSSYSLDAAVLARHVRELRRAGWQSWEIRARFDFRGAA